MRGFASDNNSGVHPEVIESLIKVNTGHCAGYGHDSYTQNIAQKIIDYFGENSTVFFMFLGTATNILAAKQLLRPYQGIICAADAHLSVDECGGPESWVGCKLLTVPTPDGKLTPDGIASRLGGRGDEHRVQAKMVSISNATELGTVYTIEELRALIDYAHSENLYVHVDGARIANAAVSVQKEMYEITSQLGVDVLSLGGTKNGLMGAEALVFFNNDLCTDFSYIHKQGMQLASKMRYLAAQFDAYFSQDLWKRNALHANNMAQYLSTSIKDNPGIQIAFLVQANAVFARIPKNYVSQLQKIKMFYTWDEPYSDSISKEWQLVRWMCSWDTSKEDIDEFIKAINRLSN